MNAPFKCVFVPLPIDRIPVRIEFAGRPPLSAMLVRHLAPRTCDSILGLLPHESRAYLWQESLIYFELPIHMGPEKARKYFKRGELLYWPLKAAVCLATADGIPFSQVNQIGQLTGIIPAASDLKAGDRVRMVTSSA